MNTTITQTLVIYLLFSYWGYSLLRNGYKVWTSETHEAFKRINFWKSEKIIFTGEPARLIAKGFIFSGSAILIFILMSLFTNLLHEGHAFLLSLVFTVVLSIYTTSKAFKIDDKTLVHRRPH